MQGRARIHSRSNTQNDDIITLAAPATHTSRATYTHTARAAKAKHTTGAEKRVTIDRARASMVAAPQFALPALNQLQQNNNLKRQRSANDDFARFLGQLLVEEAADDLLLSPGQHHQGRDNNDKDPALDLAPLVAAHLAGGAVATMTDACCHTSSASAAAAAALRFSLHGPLGSADDALLALLPAGSCGVGIGGGGGANDLSGLFDAAAAEMADASAVPVPAAWRAAGAAVMLPAPMMATALAPPPPPPLPSSLAPCVAAPAPPPAPLAAAAAAAPSPARDQDCDSVATLPMPHKRRRRASSPGPAASHDANNAPVADGGGGAGAAESRLRASRRRPSPSAAAAAAAAAPPAAPPLLPAATAGAAARAVLVAKVLTRSDATSKRIILPRVAIEANLAPQLASPSRPGASLVGTTFTFLARDATPPAPGEDAGARRDAWPMVIKAWANGSNPKPVYVLEQVAGLLASRRLGVGDAVGVLADRCGNFFVAVNTPEVRAAAARPTCAAFTFAQADAAEAAQAQAQAQADEAEVRAEAAGAAEGRLEAATEPAAPVAAEGPTRRVPAPPQAPPAAGSAPPALVMVAGGDAPSASVGRALFLSFDEGDGPAPAAPAAPAAPEVLGTTMHVAGQLVCARTSGCRRPAGHQGWCYCK